MNRFRYLKLPLLLATLFATFYTWSHVQARKHFIFETEFTITPTQELSEEEVLVFQLFYDVGEGFNEKDSQSSLIAPGQQKRLNHTIACRKLYGLRLDISNLPARIMINKLELHNLTGSEHYNLLDQAPAARNQIEALQQQPDNSLLIATIKEANDPYYLLNFTPPLRPHEEISLASELLFGGKVFLMIFVGTAIILWTTRFSEPRKSST